jgi:hypothetical protein
MELDGQSSSSNSIFCIAILRAYISIAGAEIWTGKHRNENAIYVTGKRVTVF